MTNANELKNKLKLGEITVGSWMQIPSTAVAEIMSYSGYDWIAVDLEHGAFSINDLNDIFRAIEKNGTLPLARIAQIDKKDIKQVLDSGAKGIIFPMVKDAEQLKKALSWSMYPPYGERGVGYSRANIYGKLFNEYVSHINHNLVFVAQIENINAVDCLDEILEVPGLDAIIVGPYDLSGSMGITAEFENPTFIKTIEKIRSLAKQHHIPMGMHIVQPNETLLQKHIKEGCQFIAYGTDAVFLYTNSGCPNIRSYVQYQINGE